MTRWTEADLTRLQNLKASIPSRTFKPAKYGNVKVRCDGHTFDSKAEHKRYEELVLLERAGEITKLGIHPRFRLDVLGVHVCDYEADFSYEAGGALAVEDVKGVKTAIYRLKKKLMLAVHGIVITEIS